MRIVVTIEGGVVTGVSTNDNALIGVPYTILDYDVEGADLVDTKPIFADGTKIGRAFVGDGAIDKLEVTWESQS